MSESELRFGLIGTGRIGQVHAATLAHVSGATLARVTDAVPAGADRIALQYGATPMASAEALIASDDLDAVIIASPTPTHLEFIDACIDVGMPVLCEKPIDLDIARVEALRSKVLKSSVPVALGFNQRFDPGFAEVKRRILDGEIGTPEHVTIVSRDPGPPPPEYLAVSGGIFRDMTIHDFDMARFLLGDIVEVSAFGSRLFDDGAREFGDYDTVNVMLRSR
ncbi:MAG: Gfo/Idh/MocA family oxidoreductase, partial [Agromyces sp.]